MKSDKRLGGLGVIALFGITIAAILGWVLNIVEIFHTVNDPLTAMFILRCVGAFVAPVGAILGYL